MIPLTRSRVSAGLCALVGALVLAAPAAAGTALDLSGRIQIDGFSREFLPDETLFQLTFDGSQEEDTTDSRWGRFNDVNNIKVTWDANFLYVAVDGFIFDNNMMIFFDTLPGNGITGLRDVNAWRRAMTFDNGNRPDVFLATWDGNIEPQIWQFDGGTQVRQVDISAYRSVATFDNDLEGRSMEAAIPWSVLFLDEGKDTLMTAYGDTVYYLPEGADTLRIVSWITTGADGLGGPDSAPDNLDGHEVDSSVEVVLDNFIRIPLDRFDANGDPNPDRVPDFNVQPRRPTSDFATREAYREYAESFFFVAPPFQTVSLELDRFEVEPRAIAPELGDLASFRFTLKPEISEDLARARRPNFTAEVYDVHGNRVRTLYRDQEFSIAELNAPDQPVLNLFDGRDDDGRILDAGVYILRVVLEPQRAQKKRTLVVVR